MRSIRRRMILACLLTLLCIVPTAAAPSAPPSADEIEHRAFLFFWRESDSRTGLTKDRARNIGDRADEYVVSSIASTGYALAALPVGVEHGWVKRADAYDRARTTLRFLNDRLPNVHGFFYHFVDWRNGERAWRCELSTIDSGLLALGALTCGQYFSGTEVQRLADSLYDRMDWRWAQRGGWSAGSPVPKTLAMAWRPEGGWQDARWTGYSEASFLYLLGMGAREGRDLSPDVWTAWSVTPGRSEGFDLLGGPGPLFMAQMTPAYFDLRGLTDRQGYDWWRNFENAHRAQIAFCRANAARFTSFQGGVWGITASDRPEGYGADAPTLQGCHGTVAPSAFLAGALLVPRESEAALRALWERPERARFWGRYGFSNALNVDKGWYDEDVIGIDLGMTLLALEDRRSGLIWKLIRSHPMYRKALRAAGMRPATAASYPGAGGRAGTARERSSARG